MSLRLEHRPIPFASSPAAALAGPASAVRSPDGGRPPFFREAAAAVIFVGIVFLICWRLWKKAHYVEPDPPGYQQLARDLKTGSLNQLSLRTPGLPILLLWTGS